MDNNAGFIKHVDRIGKEEFIMLFSGVVELNDWFSAEELASHPFPRHAGSLAARYLVKKRIRDFLGDNMILKEVEIMNDEYGKPEVIVGDDMSRIMMEKGIQEIMCSLSHSKNYATSMTVFVMQNK